MEQRRLAAIIFAAILLVGFATSGWAVDGTIEINQACILNAACSAIACGGTGHFPCAISASGSYRLTSNLTVSSSSTNAITVTASNVTIDLNGFTITGGGSGGSGIGISASGMNDVTVKNGGVTAFEVGVWVGTNSIVSGVHADSNYNGIIAGGGADANSIVKGCTANHSTNVGIYCFLNSCVVSGSSANNGAYGVYIAGSSALVLNDTIVSNSQYGLFASDTTTGYGQNVIFGNTVGNVSGGTSMGP